METNKDIQPNQIFTIHCSQNNANNANINKPITLDDIQQALKSNLEIKSCGGPTVWNASPEVLKLMELLAELMEQTRIYVNNKNYAEKNR